MSHLRVMHVLPDLRSGGGQGVVVNLVRHRDEAAFSYVVASLDAPYDLESTFASFGAPTVRLDRQSSGAKGALRALIAAIRAHGVDLLHVHSGPDRKFAQAAALFTGRPVVGHLHSPWNHRGSMAPAGASKLATATAVAKAAVRDGIERRVVCAYISAGDQVTEFHQPATRRAVTTVHNGISVEDFGVDADRVRATSRRALGIAADATVLVCVGRLVDGKNQDVLIAMMGSLPGAELLLVGGGPRRQVLESLADRCGVTGRVRFLGDRTDVPDLLAASDVFVFSSETEGLPLAVLEAMAARLPVVAATLPGLRGLVVEGQTGTLVDRADPSALAAAVRPLLRDPCRAREMGAAARALVTARYNAAAMAAAVEDVYRSCVKDGTKYTS